MSQDEFNPYEVSSNTGRDRRSTTDERVEVSALTIQHLSGTRPWVGFLGILAVIGTVLCGLIAGVGLIMSLSSGEPDGLLLGVIYIVVTVIYGAFASYLRSYARQIRTLELSESVEDLEQALNSQRKFWKLCGVIAAITVIAYSVAAIVGVASVWA